MLKAIKEIEIGYVDIYSETEEASGLVAIVIKIFGKDELLVSKEITYEKLRLCRDEIRKLDAEKSVILTINDRDILFTYDDTVIVEFHDEPDVFDVTTCGTIHLIESAKFWLDQIREGLSSYMYKSLY